MFVTVTLSFFLISEKSKLAKDLKKEITKVRRQLALQKGTGLVMSEAEDGKSMCTTGEF